MSSKEICFMFYYLKDTEEHQLAPDCVRHVVARTKNLLNCRLDMKKGHTAPSHHHPHEQCTYVVSGKIEATMGNEKKILQAGDSVSFDPDVEHTYLALEDSVVLESFTPMRDDIINFKN
ncbi:MAG: cupin domain-containing protein [Lachnospiraceae bacterium]|nr:cupin domain-containing protein [Lachnospiraceae bacterium]